MQQRKRVSDAAIRAAIARAAARTNTTVDARVDVDLEQLAGVDVDRQAPAPRDWARELEQVRSLLEQLPPTRPEHLPACSTSRGHFLETGHLFGFGCCQHRLEAA